MLIIDSVDDWVTEVDQRAGVVGIVVLPGDGRKIEKSGGGGEEGEEVEDGNTILERARKAVEELRRKEETKKTRSDVVQFVGVFRGGSKFGKLEETLVASSFGSGLSAGEEKNEKISIYFISSRKKVATRFVGAISGDGLFGFMRSELKNGVGVKSVDMEELKKVLTS